MLALHEKTQSQGRGKPLLLVLVLTSKRWMTSENHRKAPLSWSRSTLSHPAASARIPSAAPALHPRLLLAVLRPSPFLSPSFWSMSRSCFRESWPLVRGLLHTRPVGQTHPQRSLLQQLCTKTQDPSDVISFFNQSQEHSPLATPSERVDTDPFTRSHKAWTTLYRRRRQWVDT